MMTYRKWVQFVSIANHTTLILLLVSVNMATTYSIQSMSMDNTVEQNSGIGSQHISAHYDFSPRLDNNNAWRPVGRGDPLKNDPTFDYSPPTLDRVRYWAETNSSSSDKDAQKSYVEEGLQTYAVAERLANMGLTRKNNINNIQKNAKGEVPLLQPKYLAMRRSYYAPQLSTHLMPPPMQTIPPPMKSQMPDYQHNMLNYNTETTLPYNAPAQQGSTMPWMRTQQPVYDNHYQESVNYMHYARPNAGNTPAQAQAQQFFSPNAIRPVNMLKATTAPPRRPWLHEILEKEIVKAPDTRYQQNNIGISTTHRPLAFMPAASSSFTPTTTMIMATKSTIIPTPLTSSTAVLAQTTPAPKTTRLIIPNDSNMLYRPTVAPLRMTTDSLFKNYNQADLPLTGPMYLIIEGHSKVKTYGKDELDPHKPKIVPIVSKREPVVRVADPNERRGTIETYQVRHLHTTPMSTTTTTTTTPKPTTTTSTTTEIAAAVKPTESTTSTTTTNSATPSDAHGLFNFLDSFFAGDETTLSPTTKLQMLPVSAQNSTTEEYQRGVRQIFDYDQLPEGRVKDQDLSAEDEDEEYQTTENNATVERDDDDEEADEDEDDEEEETAGDEIIKRIDNLLNSVENEEAQDELEELLSIEDETTGIPSKA